jgi:hypothetical protein
MTQSHPYEHPTAEDVLEHEPEGSVTISPIPVETVGAVEVRSVGAVSWSSNYLLIGSTNPTQLAQSQPGRSVLILEVVTQAVWIGRTEAEARAKTGFKVGASAAKQMVMHHREELWGMADTASADVSVYQEFWAP